MVYAFGCCFERGTRRHANTHTERDSHLICFIVVNSFLHPQHPPNDWLNLFKMTSIYNWMRVREVSNKFYVCACEYVYIATLSDRFIEIRAATRLATRIHLSNPHRILFIFAVCLPTIIAFASCCGWVDVLLLLTRRSHAIHEISIENERGEKKNLPRLKLSNMMCWLGLALRK